MPPSDDEQPIRRRRTDQPGIPPVDQGNLALIQYQLTHLTTIVTDGFARIDKSFEAHDLRLAALERRQAEADAVSVALTKQASRFDGRWLPFALTLITAATVILTTLLSSK